jgi:aspartyl-tRNA(Asn)/glutamyl-tRNA(Gln) amidotransferase subunit B
MSEYIPIIGLEIHAELKTNSKLFCRCPNTSSDLNTPPNTAICPVCVGLPGALPVLNKQAVASTIKLGRSLGSTIPPTTKWDRKNYFYPDLPKGYQISQYDQPLCLGGMLSWYDRTGTEHSVALTRIHLEEDTGKLVHPEQKPYSLIDYNRSSVPLLELVTEPVISSAEEARQFAEEYQHHLRELGIAEASMEKGQMRCEANISVVTESEAADPGRRLSGTKIEVKNLNSFRSLERAINFEIKRQSEALNQEDRLRQETRGWREVKGETYSMRAKETADDYRYFPEPDLGQLDLDRAEKNDQDGVSRQAVIAQLLKAQANPNFVHIVTDDPRRWSYIKLLLSDPNIHDESIALSVQWLSQDPNIVRFEPQEIVAVMTELSAGNIRTAALKAALASADRGGLKEALDQSQSGASDIDLGSVVRSVLAEHTSEVVRYRSGEVQLFGFFVGNVRKIIGYKADPSDITEILKRQLDQAK